ncbi:DUF3515 domain-containing protein [Saccharomonospora glauca]|uniref:DUF3515 domain-containing protein n=1 Tax=Saccharomonospora glauca K62 TaxID=928724 RepID=I1CZ06_9PSEU|nr:Protein of unknown function (DUF3515) [Saccharomonospora glauca K62]
MVSETGAPPRSLVVLAAVLATALAVTVAVLGFVLSPGEPDRDASDKDGPDASGPLPLVSIPAPQSGSSECTSLVEAAPLELESSGERLARRELAEPAPPATLAWGHGEPVVLRCGLDRPPELTRSSTLRSIDGVQWLPVPGEASTTWYVVDRDVYIALTVPQTAGTGPLQQLSETVADVLPAVPLDFE